MNLKVNNIAFNGKSEILYGLDRASKLAQTIEYNKLAYRNPENLQENTIFNAMMRTYLDMVTKDDCFSSAVRIFTLKDLRSVRENLKDLPTKLGTVKSFKLFKSTLEDIIKYNRNGLAAKKIASEELLKLLA